MNHIEETFKESINERTEERGKVKRQSMVLSLGYGWLQNSQRGKESNITEGHNRRSGRKLMSSWGVAKVYRNAVYTALIELGKGLLCVWTIVPRPHWEGRVAVVVVPPASISTSTLTWEKPASCIILVTCECNKDFYYLINFFFK